MLYYDVIYRMWTLTVVGVLYLAHVNQGYGRFTHATL